MIGIHPDSAAGSGGVVPATKPPRELLPGVYAPLLCFFKPNSEDLDLCCYAAHVIRLVKAGVVGFVVNGSIGEADHISAEERRILILTAREALDRNGHTETALIAGTSASGIRQTIALAEAAANCGIDYILVKVPSAYPYSMTSYDEQLPDGGTIHRYFTSVADASPRPVILYNYPTAAAGLDLSSDAMLALADHPNIVGAKFTCANLGKLARVSRGVSGKRPDGAPKWRSFAGMADFILPALVVGAFGVIAGAANIYPRSCVRLWNSAVAMDREGRALGGDEAGRDFKFRTRQYQMELAEADWLLTKAGIPGYKALLAKHEGYGGYARGPLPRCPTSEAEELCEASEEFSLEEKRLADEALTSPLN